MTMNNNITEQEIGNTHSHLLTWYGITDLRAALGLEPSGGPVLGALRTGEFTDVIILGYTDPTKAGESIARKQSEWHLWLDRPPAERETLTRPRELELVDAFSNTSEAHGLFKEWLRSEIEAAGLSVNVRLCVKELAILNDSKGIYDAVVRALDLVAKDRKKKRITFYLSPGTPVMAFTWAFVALANPELDIQILSSSEPRQPPTLINLPYDLLAPSNRRLKQVSQGDSMEFDVVFHLFGEQRMAPLLGVLQFPAKHHIFVTSDQYSSEIMKQFMPDGAWSELRVNPFDPMSAKIQILKSVASLPTESRVGFNLTGGTKLMFAGAIAACRKVGGTPFYFETQNHNLVFLHDFAVMPMRGIDNLDMFFEANGFSVLNQGNWNDNPCRQIRIPLTNILWIERYAIAHTYWQISQYTKFYGDSFIPFKKSFSDRKGELLCEVELDNNGRASINLKGTKYSFEYCPDFAKYLCGGWLEEYVYLSLHPLLRENVIRDLRVGLDITWKSNDESIANPIQEFDVTVTDGKRLFIVECKAGSLTNDHVYKLQHCVRNYGGIDARGIMACAVGPIKSLTKKRLESTGNLVGLYEADIADHIAHVITTYKW